MGNIFRINKKGLLFLFLILSCIITKSQEVKEDFWFPASGYNKTRFFWVTGLQLTGSASSLYLLNKLWYEEYQGSGFTFHNDFNDWFQMDKLGHSTTAYHLSRISAQSFRWSGLENKSSAWYGVITGTGFLTFVEVLDGFSSGWGFSVADFSANTIGAASFLSQQLFWNQQKILFKYSFSPSGFEKYRPQLLGIGLHQNMLKDYNGQTYWISANLNSLSGNTEFFPKWLNIAIGHSANGMLGSLSNPESYNGIILPSQPRCRQWLVSPDIDWQKIPTNNGFLLTLFSVLNFIKFPAPAIEYNKVEGFKFHLLYF